MRRDEKACWKYEFTRVGVNCWGSDNREFQILQDATEKPRVRNAVYANATVSRLVLEDLRERPGV